jgi:hypothetical protein
MVCVLLTVTGLSRGLKREWKIFLDKGVRVMRNYEP